MRESEALLGLQALVNWDTFHKEIGFSRVLGGTGQNDPRRQRWRKWAEVSGQAQSSSEHARHHQAPATNFELSPHTPPNSDWRMDNVGSRRHRAVAFRVTWDLP